jgi:hypothetical protein
MQQGLSTFATAVQFTAVVALGYGTLHSKTHRLSLLHLAEEFGLLLSNVCAYCCCGQAPVNIGQTLTVPSLCRLQEEFSALLPLYLTAEHFNRALPHMEPLLKLLAPERVSTTKILRVNM